VPTVECIVTAATWDQRVARIRLIPQHHGTSEHPAIHAAVDQARVAAETLSQVIAGTLFGDPPGDLKSKQDKPDTERAQDRARGWNTQARA
jgi:hypothetical protein